MKFTRREFLGFAAAGLSANGLSACSSEDGGGPLTLRLGHYGGINDTVTRAAQHFKSLVEERSGGTIRIAVHPGGELGNDSARLQSVRLGALDMTVAGNPYYTTFAPVMNLLDLPYLFDGRDHVSRTLDGSVGQHLLDELSRHRLVGLAYWEVGFRHLTNSVRPVVTPADLNGLKIRTTPNEAHVKAFTLLGANPAQMPFAELYLALQTRAVDGQENPINSIYAMRFFEVQDYLSLTRHAYTAAPIVVSASRWRRLSEQQQALLKGAAEAAGAYQRALNAESENAYLERIGDAGVSIESEPDIPAFRARVAEATRADYAAQHGVELLRAVDSA